MSRTIAVVLLFGLGFIMPARAQTRAEPSDQSFWIGAAAVVVAAALLDEEARSLAGRHQSRFFDRVGDAVDPLGRARYLVPSMVGAYVVARAVGRRHWSEAVLRIGLGYAIADAMGSVLKRSVGRHRPDTIGGPWRFKPFDPRGEWHSFPSAHTVHAFALAAGVAEEARRPGVSAVSYGAASLVALQRVYRGAHWASDVAGGAVLAVGASKITNRRLRRRRAAGQTAGAKLDVVVLPSGIAGSLTLPR